MLRLRSNCALPLLDHAAAISLRPSVCLFGFLTAPRTQVKGNGADTYLHRVGRAGRFGTKGLAITFVASEKDSEVLNQVRG